MQSAYFITALLKQIPSSEGKSLVTSLHQDPLVWDRLQDEAFAEKAIQSIGSETDRWSPAAITLLDLNLEIKANELTNGSHELPFELSQQAARYFEQTIHEQTQPKELKDAGLLALALLDKTKTEKNWANVFQTVLPKSTETAGLSYRTWRTAIAILFGMTLDHIDFAKGLIPKKVTPIATRWLVNAVLSNIHYEEKQTKFFEDLLPMLPSSQQSSILRELSLIGLKGMTEELALKLLKVNQQTAAFLFNKTNLTEMDLESSLAWGLELERLAGLYRLCNQPANAMLLLEKAKQTIVLWSSGLKMQLLDVAGETEKKQNPHFMDEIVLPASFSSSFQVEAFTSYGIDQCSNNSCDLTGIDDPRARLIQAWKTAQHGDIELAQEIARKACQEWMMSIRLDDTLGFQPKFIYEWQPSEWVKLVVEMGLEEEARLLGEAFFQVKPNDLDLVEELAHLASDFKDWETAAGFASQLCAIRPDDPASHRLLAQQWEALNKWDEAYLERITTVELASHTNLNDQVKLGEAALHIGRWDKVEEACLSGLDIHPDHGRLMAMLGKAYLEQGKMEQAAAMLNRATLVEPDLQDAWKDLAEYYSKLGNEQKVLETLRAAVLAIPDSVEINYLLGKRCLDRGLDSDALPYLRQAAIGSPDRAEVQYDYGDTLRRLGHSVEAFQVLEQSWSRWPNFPDLAYAYAQSAIENGHRDSALDALERAVQTQDPKYDWVDLYARTLLLEHSENPVSSTKEVVRLTSAEKSLERFVEELQDIEKRLLLAELIEARGNADEALLKFAEINEALTSDQADLNWRIQAGIGRAELKLGQIEAALAAIQEANHLHPEDSGIVHSLAEAYMAANLKQEAIQAANTALKLTPDSVANLNWFARFMSDCNQLDEAIQALRWASELDVHKAQYQLQIGGLQARMGKNQEAVTTLREAVSAGDLDETGYHQAAEIFSALNHHELAIDSLKCAAALSGQRNAEILFELSELQAASGDFDGAMTSIQHLQNALPDEAASHILQADLYDQLGNEQNAIASLSHALRLEESENSSQQLDWDKLGKSKLLKTNEIAKIRLPETIHERFSKIYRKTGDMGLALNHAEKALQIAPQNTELRSMAAEFARSAMLLGRAEKLATEAQSDNSCAELDLLALRLETALDANEEENAGMVLELARRCGEETARILSSRIRLMVLQGNLKGAEELYSKGNIGKIDEIWAAEAALAVKKWKTALRIFESWIHAHPAEAYGLVRYARALTLMAEEQRLCNELDIVNHAPGSEALSQKRFEQLEIALKNAQQLTSNKEVARWQVRGRAAFHPAADELRELAAWLPAQDEGAALIAGLRTAGNLASAITIGQQMDETPTVLVQLALCQNKVDPHRAVESAWHAVENQPESPAAQIALGLAAEACGDIAGASNAIEAALRIWDDEPLWHARAARLNGLMGEFDNAAVHWAKAVEMKPEALEWKVAYGKMLVKNGESEKAEEILEEVSIKDASRVDTWVALAEAKKMNGALKEALACAENALKIEPGRASSHILCGEIALAAGQKQEALHFAKEAVARDPKSPAAVLFNAQVTAKTGSPNEALNLLERALKEIDSHELRVERARLTAELRGQRVAIPLYKELLQQQPGDCAVLAMLAKAQVEAGDLAGAAVSAQRALEIDPTDPDLQLLMGKISHNSGQLDQAVSHLSEAVRLAPAEIENYLELGRAYLDRREQDEGLRVFQRAMRIAGKDYRPYYQAAIALRDMKDYSGAETMLRKAAELAPNEITIQRQLGAVMALNLVMNSQEASANYESYPTQRQ